MFYVHPSAKCLCVDETQPLCLVGRSHLGRNLFSDRRHIIVNALGEAAEPLKKLALVALKGGRVDAFFE